MEPTLPKTASGLVSAFKKLHDSWGPRLEDTLRNAVFAIVEYGGTMDQGKVLIVNLSKGRVGEDNAMLLGAFLVTAIQQAAMTRADVPEAERRDFSLYIDEFQNFTTSSFASILSEARKYRLNLTIAHQYLTQLDDSTADAVFGNVGSIIAFQVGADDAEDLAEQLSKHPGQLKSQDLCNLPKYMAYARLLVDGMPTNPFSVQTLAPPTVNEDRLGIVTDQSRREHAYRVVQAGNLA